MTWDSMGEAHDEVSLASCPLEALGTDEVGSVGRERWAMGCGDSYEGESGGKSTRFLLEPAVGLCGGTVVGLF